MSPSVGVLVHGWASSGLKSGQYDWDATPTSADDTTVEMSAKTCMISPQRAAQATGCENCQTALEKWTNTFGNRKKTRKKKVGTKTYHTDACRQAHIPTLSHTHTHARTHAHTHACLHIGSKWQVASE